MKINPVAAGAASPAQTNPDEGRSASPDRVARAKAVLAGGTASVVPKEEPTLTDDPQVTRVTKMRKIKMKTNVTPEYIPSQPLEEISQTTEPPITDTSDINESAVASSEEIKPLSPQYAALVKEKRALQMERAKLEQERKAFDSQGTDTKSAQELVERLKTNPLSVLQEHGVTYDKLTEDLLAESGDNSGQISRLEAKIKSLEEGLQNQNKSLTDRDAQAEQQVLSHIRKDTDRLVASDDNYEMIRIEKAQGAVVKLMHAHWKETGDMMDLTQALQLVEDQLIEENLARAQSKKIQSRLNQKQQPVASPTKPIRTLTNRDGVSPPMSSRERAILAFQGRLPR